MSELLPSCILEIFAQEKRFQGIKSVLLFSRLFSPFFPNLTGKSSEFWQKKSRVRRKKFYQGWEDCLHFYRMDLLAKNVDIWEDSISEEIFDLGTIFPLPFPETFRDVVKKTCQFFRGLFEDENFFVEKMYLLL